MYNVQGQYVPESSFERVSRLFRPLRTSDRHSALGISPTELDLFSITIVICLFIGRTIKHALGFGLPFVPVEDKIKTLDNTSHDDEQYFTLPDLSLHMPLKLNSGVRSCFALAVDSDGFPTPDNVVNNAQICLYLAAVSEPAMLLMLAKRGCPIRPLGAVNVRNRFEILEPETCQALFKDPLQTSLKSMRFSVLAKFPRPARRVRRGLEIDIEVSIIMSDAQDNADAPVQSPALSQKFSSAIFLQEFTMLQFTKFKTKSTLHSSAKLDSQTTAKPKAADRDLLFTVPLDSRSPSYWARLCKDYNPIHFSPILAKLLGQPGQLAHGNHAVSVCVQAMSHAAHNTSHAIVNAVTETQERKAMQRFVVKNMESAVYGGRGWWMEVRFRRPIVLPANIGPKLNDSNDGFDVMDAKTGRTSVVINMGNL